MFSGAEFFWVMFGQVCDLDPALSRLDRLCVLVDRWAGLVSASYPSTRRKACAFALLALLTPPSSFVIGPEAGERLFEQILCATQTSGTSNFRQLC